MPRLRIELASKYYSKLPRRAALLDDERFLACVRQNRSGNRADYSCHYSSRKGLYGFTPAEWKRVAGPYVDLDEGEPLKRLAYRWFVHCWHECLINGFPVTVYNVAVFWQHGDHVAPMKIRKRISVRWAKQISTLYKINEI